MASNYDPSIARPDQGAQKSQQTDTPAKNPAPPAQNQVTRQAQPRNPSDQGNQSGRQQSAGANEGSQRRSASGSGSIDDKNERRAMTQQDPQKRSSEDVEEDQDVERRGED
ncbi:MAG TPA: hypothetical protein VIM71_03385 [Lacunisphaera sp.]